MPTDPFEQFFRRPTRRSFQALVHAEQRSVTSAAWRILGDPGLAEDVAQEIFMAVLEHSKNPEASQGRARWLSKTVGVARTKLRSERRRRTRENHAAEERENVLDASQQAALFEVRDAVAALPEEWRQCTELRYFGGLSSEEVAAELNLARRTVDERLGKARRQLEAKLSVMGLATLTSPPQLTPTGLATTKLLSLASSVPTLTATAKSVLFVAAFLSVFSAYWVVTQLESFGGSSGTKTEISALEEPILQGTPTREASSNDPLQEELTTLQGSLPERQTAADLESKSVAQQAALAPASKRIHVRVVDENNVAVPGATLRFQTAGLKTLSALHSLDTLFEPFQHLLDPIHLGTQSEWSVGGLPQEISGLTFVLNGYIESQGSAEPITFAVAEGLETDLIVVCPTPRRVRVSCTHAVTGAPIAHAVVTMKTEARRRDLDLTASSFSVDEEGWVELDRLGAGDQEILVQAAGFAPVEAHLPLDGPSEVRVELAPLSDAATLRVRARDPIGDPIEGTAVKLFNAAAGVQHVALTDSQGEVEFVDLPPDTNYTVELDLSSIVHLFRGRSRTPDRWTALMGFVELKPGQSKLVNLGELHGNARRAFQFVNAEGAALAHQEISLYGPVGKSLETDENGWVVLNKVPAGEWQMEFFPGRSHAFTIGEGDESNTEHQVILGDASIEGTVRDFKGRPVAGALVVLIGSQSEMTKSGDNGRFQIENLPRGEMFELRVHHAEFEEHKTETATDRQGASVTVEIQLGTKN